MAGDAAGREQKYWFAVAVFRDASDADASLGQLRATTFDQQNMLVLCDKTISAKLNGEGTALPSGLKSFVHALKDNGDDTRDGGNRGQSRVYSHLLRDISGGAVVLVASAASAEQQLEGARVLLRGNSECVLTHEIVDRRSDVG